MFAAVALVCLGLAQRGRRPWLLLGQVAIVYFGAGLSKATDPDWRSGHFMAAWGRFTITQGGRIFPPNTAGLRVAQAVSWLTICVELFLAVVFLLAALGLPSRQRPRTRTRFFGIAIFVGIALHTVMFVVTARTFGVFLFVAPAVYLALVDWPTASVEVLYDGDCRFCTRTRRFFERIDFDRTFRWIAFGESKAHHGIHETALEQSIHVFDRGTSTGFVAFKKLVLRLPAVLLIATLVMALGTRATGPLLWPFRGLAALLLIVFMPPLEPIGEAAYRLVSRNRHRLGSPKCST